MEKYMVDLKGVCYHEGTQRVKEWQYKFYKFNFFDTPTAAFDFMNEYVRAFPATYKSILPNRVKRFNYFYTYSVYRVEGDSITEVDHDTVIREVLR